MSESVSEPLNNVELPQEIMATEQPSVSSLDSAQSTAEQMNNIRTEHLPQEITTTVESISTNETISVSTQVNIISGHQDETNEFTTQALLHTTTMSEKNIVPEGETVSLPDNTIAMTADGPTIVNNSQGELIEIVPVSSLPSLSSMPALNPNLPPWAARLRDCELIGDSYRGYVTNEVELDLILTLHKQHTNSCWGTRQSPSSAKPSIRLMWKSQYVPYDGIPFLNTGRRATVMECQYGPRRKGSNTKKTREYDNQGNAVKKGHRPTCPARIYIKKVKKFPEYRIEVDLNLEGKNVRQAQERALAHLRLAGVESGGEERFYVQLPLPVAHEYHDIEDITLTQSPDSRGQRLDQQVADKIYELVARGVTGVYTIKHCLKEFVEREMYPGQEAPPRHNKAYFPTIIDLQNHIHEAQLALASGQLLPLPPLNNPPIGSSPAKERTRKRKQPTKHSQTSQTINRLQTDEAVASITQLDDTDSSSEARDEKPEKTNQHLQEELTQFNESNSQPLVITHGQTDPAKNGQVVIVVTSNNVFSTGQDNDTPTSFAHLSLPSSHITNMPSTSFGTLPTGSQAVLIAHQQGDSGQYQLAPQGNVLTVVNPAIHGINPNQRVVLRMMTNQGSVSGVVEPQLEQSGPEHLLANQAALAAVLNVAVQKTPDNKQEQGDGEPPLKRQTAVSIDLSSLVKEAGFDGNNVQIPGVELRARETATSNSAILSTADNTSPSYTDHTTETVQYSYHDNDCKQTNQDLHDVHNDVTSADEGPSVLDSVADFQVLDDDDNQATDHVDARQIHPITMETSELINSFPKFSNTSESPVMHVTSDVSLISTTHSTTNASMVEDPNSYQSAVEQTQNTSNEELKPTSNGQ